MKYLYLAVTTDEYELPLIVSDSVEGLSKFSGVNKRCIYSSISKKSSGKNNKIKFIKVSVTN